jgi:hypothetical protein
VTQDERANARRADGLVKEPRRNIGRAADLSSFQDNGPNPASLCFLLLKQGMELHLSRIQHKGFERPHFRTQFQGALTKIWKVGMQACRVPTFVNDLIEPHLVQGFHVGVGIRINQMGLSPLGVSF